MGRRRQNRWRRGGYRDARRRPLLRDQTASPVPSSRRPIVDAVSTLLRKGGDQRTRYRSSSAHGQSGTRHLSSTFWNVHFADGTPLLRHSSSRFGADRLEGAVFLSTAHRLGAWEVHASPLEPPPGAAVDPDERVARIVAEARRQHGAALPRSVRTERQGRAVTELQPPRRGPYLFAALQRTSRSPVPTAYWGSRKAAFRRS